jgi:D-alanyl-D-alanine carboxypeptidase (penicillin-binding protein 5/6)
MLTPRATLLAGSAVAGLLLAVLSPSTAQAALRSADVIGGPALGSPGVVVHAGPGSTPLPAVQADSWLVADLTTGDVLAAKAAHRRARPASMLKTLTAVTLMPTLPMKGVHTATYAEATADGGHVGIVPGATYTHEDLWHGLLLPSGNDAAAALADSYGGMAKTVTAMQAQARTLQAFDTFVKNPSGLDADGQVSSAYDMALIARAAMQLPDFQGVTSALRYDFPGKPGNPRPTYKIYTQNRLLLHGYHGTIGGKTGFTSLAHRTFWGAATRGGHTLVVTLFQIGEPTERAARALLDWGFANDGKVTPVGTLVDPAEPSHGTGPAASAPADVPATGPGAGTSASASGGSRSITAGALAGVLVLVVAAAGAFWWWRRRSVPGSDAEGAARSTPVATPPATSEPAGSAPEALAPRPAAAPLRSSVVVVRKTPATSATDDTGPIPVVASLASPEPELEPEPVVAVIDPEPIEVEAPGAPAEDVGVALAPERARPAPVSGGHVRIITPPGGTAR